MQKFCLGVVFLIFFVVLPVRSYAQRTTIIGSQKIEVTAMVGGLYLNISGYISPYASIVLTSDNIFLRATTADNQGNFFISQVFIKQGFSHFCLDAIDFHRLGESLSCVSFPPAQGNLTIKDLFLPPTLGLEHTTVASGARNLAFGYTMPNALVMLSLNGKILTTTADATGYYQFILQNLLPGDYTVFAKARLNKKDSLAPSRVLKFKSLSLWEQFITFLQDLLKKLLHLLTSIALGPLWLVIPMLILIIILILKIWPERFTIIYESRLFAFLPHPEKKPVHHDMWIAELV